MGTQRTGQLEHLKQLWRYQIETVPDPPHRLLLDHFFSYCVERVVDIQEILKIINCPGELDEASITLSVGRVVRADYLDPSALEWYWGEHNNPPRIMDSSGATVPIVESLYYLGQLIFETLSLDRKTHLTLLIFSVKTPVFIVALRSVIARYVGKKTTEGLTRTSGDRLVGFPEGVEWEDVTITFQTLDSVEIRARSFSKKYHYAELDFQDRRTTEMADKQWKILQLMALNRGSLSWKDSTLVLKQSISMLRARLKHLTGIDDDPFHPYRPARKYSSRFTLALKESVRINLEADNADNQESDTDQVFSEETSPRYVKSTEVLK